MDVDSHIESGPRKRSDYIIAEYKKNGAGEWEVMIPAGCPCDGMDGERCRVGCHSMRERKTGPGHALMVLRCLEHGRHYTVYPLGYAPYLRCPLDSEGDSSLFEAARDGAIGEAWPRGPSAEGCWRTQTRRIAYLAMLLGLLASRVSTQDEVAEALGVTLHSHRASASVLGSPEAGYRSRSLAIMGIVDQVEHPLRFLKAGYLTGVIGRAWHVTKIGSSACLRAAF